MSDDLLPDRLVEGLPAMTEGAILGWGSGAYTRWWSPKWRLWPSKSVCFPPTVLRWADNKNDKEGRWGHHVGRPLQLHLRRRPQLPVAGLREPFSTRSRPLQLGRQERSEKRDRH